jgi:hypothetical protein
MKAEIKTGVRLFNREVPEVNEKKTMEFIQSLVDLYEFKFVGSMRNCIYMEQQYVLWEFCDNGGEINVCARNTDRLIHSIPTTSTKIDVSGVTAAYRTYCAVMDNWSEIDWNLRAEKMFEDEPESLNQVVDPAAPVGCPFELIDNLFATNGTGKKMALNKSQRFTTIEPTIYGYVSYAGSVQVTQVIVCCGGVAYLLEINPKTRRARRASAGHLTHSGWETIRSGGTPQAMTTEAFDNLLNSWIK